VEIESWERLQYRGGIMPEYTGKEYCRKCGMETYPSSKKYSVSGGEYYCVKCAERADREYLIKNSCSVCRRLLKSNEVKLVLPSKVYGGTQLPLVDRLICTKCYNAMGTRSISRRSFKQKVEQVRTSIRKGMVKRAVREYVQA
jgi:hypothetical protein